MPWLISRIVDERTLKSTSVTVKPLRLTRVPITLIGSVTLEPLSRNQNGPVASFCARVLMTITTTATRAMSTVLNIRAVGLYMYLVYVTVYILALLRRVLEGSYAKKQSAEVPPKVPR